MIKKLTNTSARKHLLTKLSDSNIPDRQIVQISGHKNIASINSYAQMSRKRQNEISDISSNSGKTVKITATPSDLKIFVRTMSTLTSTPLTAPSPYSFLNNCTIHGSVTINFPVQNQSLANQQPSQLTFQRTNEQSMSQHQ